MKADFIKMDIEGFEEKALKGMRNLLQRSRTVKILTEFYPKYLILAGTKPEDYLKQLSGLGFKVYDLHGHDVFSRPASVKMLLERYTFENNHLTNLLCLR